MDLQRMISELEAERDRLDEAILALERLSQANTAGRRPRHFHVQREDALADAETGDISVEVADLSLDGSNKSS